MKRGSAILPPELAQGARVSGTAVVCTTGSRIGSDWFDIGGPKEERSVPLRRVFD